jgi:hypothetical protein
MLLKRLAIRARMNRKRELTPSLPVLIVNDH